MKNEFVQSVVEEADEEHPDSPDDAVNYAITRLVDHPEYETFVNGLVREAVRSLVHRRRHVINVHIRKAAGKYNNKPKVIVGKCPDVLEAYRVFSLRLGSKTVGNMTGAELKSTAMTEKAISNGHLLNVKFCKRLAKIVPDDVKVKDAISEDKAQEIWEELKAGTKVETETQAGKSKRCPKGEVKPIQRLGESPRVSL